MAVEGEGVKISLDSVGLMLSSAMPSFANVKNETHDLRSMEHSQRSFIFVPRDENEESLSIVVLDKSSLDAIQTKSLAVYEQLRQKTMALDYKSMLPSMTQLQVEEKLTELLRENCKLKQTLATNNIAMKQHLVTLVAEQEKLSKVHDSHRQKFTEIKSLVNQLKAENGELKTQIKNFCKETKEQGIQSEIQTNINSLERRKDEKSFDTQQNNEIMKLALKCEEQTQEIAEMQKIIISLKEQIDSYCRNTLISIKLDDTYSSLANSEDSMTLKSFDQLTICNNTLKSLGNSHESQISQQPEFEKLLINANNFFLENCSQKLIESQKQEVETQSLNNQLENQNSEVKAQTENVQKAKNRSGTETGILTETESTEVIKDENSVDKEIANDETANGATECEGHVQEIAQLQTAIASLEKKIDSRSQNKINLNETSFVRDSTTLNDAYSFLPKTKDASNLQYFDNLTSYKNMLQSLDNCNTSQASRHIRIQECLQRCNEILLENPNSNESSNENPEVLEKRRKLQICRDKLIDEELGTLIERQEMINLQNVYQKIFHDYSTAISQLIQMRMENERFKMLKIGDKVYEDRLEAEKTNLREIERLLEEERRSFMIANRELSEKRLELEKEYLMIQENEKKLVEANASLNDDVVLLKEQLKVYEAQYEEAMQLQKTMFDENTRLLDRIKQLESNSHM